MLQAFEQDVGVSGPTERFGHPAELGPGLLGPVLGQELPKGAQIRPEAPGGHPGLVHVLRIFVEPHAEIVGQQAQVTLGDGGPDHLAHRCVALDRDRSDVGRLGGSKPDGPHQLRPGVAGHGAGFLEPGHGGVEQRRRHGADHLDLHFAKAGRQAAAVHHGHHVIVDFEQWLPETPGQQSPPALGDQAGNRSQPGSPPVGPHQPGDLGGNGPPLAGPVDLPTGQARFRRLLGQFEGPLSRCRRR